MTDYQIKMQKVVDAIPGLECDFTVDTGVVACKLKMTHPEGVHQQLIGLSPGKTDQSDEELVEEAITKFFRGLTRKVLGVKPS